MKIASTIQQAREAKSQKQNAVKVNAVNNTTTNGTNNTANNNAAVNQQKTVARTDTVEISKKSLALAKITQSELKVEEATAREKFQYGSKVKKENKRIGANGNAQDARKNVAKGIEQSMRDLSQRVSGLKKKGVNSRGISKVEVNAPSITVSAEKYGSKKRVAGNRKVQDVRENATKKIERSLRELSHLVSGLKKIGVNSREITKVVESANREVNKTISSEIKKAYNDYRTNKIDKQSLHNMLYGTAAKKLDGMTSALKNAFDQRLSSFQDKTSSAKTIEASAQAEDALSGIVADVTKDIEDISIDGDRSLDKMFDKVIDFFNDIDKMINGFADKAEGKGNDEDKGGSLLNFVSILNEMFSGINKAFGKESREETLGHRIGMNAANKETIGQLFNSENGSGAIHRIGDAGEGSGNFNAVSFMSSISNGINDALESYRDIQKAEKEAKEEAQEESKEAVSTLA